MTSKYGTAEEFYNDESGDLQDAVLEDVATLLPPGASMITWDGSPYIMFDRDTSSKTIYETLQKTNQWWQENVPKDPNPYGEFGAPTAHLGDLDEPDNVGMWIEGNGLMTMYGVNVPLSDGIIESKYVQDDSIDVLDYTKGAYDRDKPKDWMRGDVDDGFGGSFPRTDDYPPIINLPSDPMPPPEDGIMDLPSRTEEFRGIRRPSDDIDLIDLPEREPLNDLEDLASDNQSQSDRNVGDPKREEYRGLPNQGSYRKRGGRGRLR